MDPDGPIQEEPDKIHVRPAKFGDICVLLEPIAKDEIIYLRQRQMPLQALFGGSPIENVHLSCQRFEAQDERLLQGLVQNLNSALSAVQPFALTALGLETLYAQVRQTNILKWRIQVTPDLQRFIESVENVLIATGITPLYTSGWVPSLVSALKGVPEINLNSVPNTIAFPYHLFTAHKVVLSRIDGPNEFEVLATIQLPAF